MCTSYDYYTVNCKVNQVSNDELLCSSGRPFGGDGGGGRDAQLGGDGARGGGGGDRLLRGRLCRVRGAVRNASAALQCTEWTGDRETP